MTGLRLRGSALLAAVACATGAAAQEAPTSPEETDEVTTLSPFEVNSDKDTGYVATNTLAGSRLNTSLTNTPASISVMTKDFLDDIGAISVTQAMEYSVNGGNDISGGASNNRGDTGNGLIGNDYNFQVRGYRRATQTRDYFVTPLDGDTYNIERIDVARGPNSLLFGVGGPSGVINTTTKRADPNRDFGQVALRVGSYNHHRATLDVNQGLLDNRFGVRANLLYQDADGYHDFESDDQKRGALALTWKPTNSTTIRINGETGSLHQNRVRPWTAVDQFSRWESIGRPVFAFGTPQSPAGNLAPIQTDAVINDTHFTQGQSTAVVGGMANGRTEHEFLTGNAGNYIVVTDGPLAGVPIFTGGDRSLGGGLGSFRGARYYRLSNSFGNQSGFDTSFPVTDESLYPRTSNPAGPAQFVEIDYHQFSATIDQRIGENLHLEATANRTVREFYNQTTLGFSQISLFYDATSMLPTFNPDGSFAASLGGPTTTGQGRGALNFGPTVNNLLTGEVEANPAGGGLLPNPYVGKQIISGWNPSTSTTKGTFDDFRLSASYQLDLGKFGKHHLLAFATRNETENETENFSLGNLDPNRASPNVSSNLPTLITHVDVLSPNIRDRGLPDVFDDPSVLVGTNQVRGVQSLAPGQPYTPEYYTPGFYRNNMSRSFRQTDSAAIAAHSSFFNETLVTTVGVRRDRIKAYNQGTVARDPDTRIVTGWNDAHILTLDETGDTYSAGAVYHTPLKWLSVFANQSTNFQDQSNASRFEDEVNRPNLEIGPLEGLGRDFGIKTRFFGDRINATLTRYEVEQSNVAVGVGSAQITQYINAIWTTIQNNGPDTVQTDAENPTGHHVGGSDTRSQVSEGWEFELTANPTREWRVSFNISKSDNILSDLGSNLEAYLDKHRAEWTSHSALNYNTGAAPGFLNNEGGSNTVGALVHGLDNVWLPFAKSNEGVSEINIRPWNANFFTAYTVREGRLKGLTLGGGVNYHGPAIIGIRPPSAEDPSYEVFEGHIYYLVNAMASYSFKLGDKTDVKLQLNVNNLLDLDDLQLLSSNWDPVSQSIGKWYYHLQPRTYSLTATFSF